MMAPVCSPVALPPAQCREASSQEFDETVYGLAFWLFAPSFLAIGWKIIQEPPLSMRVDWAPDALIPDLAKQPPTPNPVAKLATFM
ncbi:hypothetical protein BT67DRAFT_50297 [Trichocladium antarcticum]|uniref:Uncharacterized protein n=1 Tax=Trichocladium antarcticum TaxID=1450529 RepID=A0AAN6ZD25_9PEZI|nr:hypothetical protein BT67DRAFT_50297 [Trichocladium antarcticum]